jgi:hypothetical protein
LILPGCSFFKNFSQARSSKGYYKSDDKSVARERKEKKQCVRKKNSVEFVMNEHEKPSFIATTYEPPTSAPNTKAQQIKQAFNP